MQNWNRRHVIMTEEKNQKEAALESKMERWMYLNELAERIEAGERQT